MKTLLFAFCLSVIIVYITAVPVANQNEEQLTSSEEGPQARPKRTIGILRDIFPNFSQMVDRKIQALTRIIFRIVGRLVLTGGGGNGGGAGGGDSDDDRKISITLPTYPPDLIDDEDEDTTGASTTDSSAAETTPDGEENSVAAESRLKPVRAKRGLQKQELDDEEEEDEDLEPEATGDNEVSDDNDADGSEVDGEEDDEDPRNKRFLNFNLGASANAQAGGAGSGSGGGSGNFLFDIIRRSADRAARMAGTVYRVLAGTDDAGLPTYESARSLVAGSGSSGQTPDGGDGSTNAAIEEPKDGVGVPGPLTRLFVVANKGVSALIQDLILRLAQTSEKIVNFKARLITSII